MNDKALFLKETQEHVDNVKSFIDVVIERLKCRAVIHDHTKFKNPERDTFIEMTPKLKGSTYGSPEYKGFLKEMKTILDHHYANNKHHPEHYEQGIDGMDLIDIIELFCDWKAATLRHNDGNLNESIDKNKERFKLSDQLVNIFRNSVALFDYVSDKDLTGVNIGQPYIEVNHKDMARFGNSYYKSVCPKCERGILLFNRDQKTLVLLDYDRCLLCGQLFKYKDVEELRKAEHNEHGIEQRTEVK